jgi:G patch domain-containing protein 1
VAETNLVCFTAEVDAELLHNPADHDDESPPSRQRSPPPQYPASEASGTSAFRPPPSFSSLFPAQEDPDASGVALESCEAYKQQPAVGETTNDSAPASSAAAAPAYAPLDNDQVAPESSNSASAALRLQDETKRALPRDTKSQAGEPSRSSSSAKDDEAEPPPAYSEGDSPLHSFTYLMAAAGGAASIITQVQQGGPSLNPLGGW